MISSEKKHTIWKEYLPCQEEEQGLEAPSAAIHVIPVKDEDSLLRGEPSVPEQEHDVVELAVDVPHDDDGLVRPRVDADDVGLTVEDDGCGDDEPPDEVRGEHRGELVRREAPRAPVQRRSEAGHPVPCQHAVLGPLDRRGLRDRGGGRRGVEHAALGPLGERGLRGRRGERRGFERAVGLRHGMDRIRRGELDDFLPLLPLLRFLGERAESSLRV